MLHSAGQKNVRAPPTHRLAFSKARLRGGHGGHGRATGSAGPLLAAAEADQQSPRESAPARRPKSKARVSKAKAGATSSKGSKAAGGETAAVAAVPTAAAPVVGTTAGGGGRWVHVPD